MTDFEKVPPLLEQKWTLKTYNYPRREIVAVRQREGEDEGNKSCLHSNTFSLGRVTAAIFTCAGIPAFCTSFFLHMTKAERVTG